MDRTTFAILAFTILSGIGCNEVPAPVPEETIDIRRIESSVEVRRALEEAELLWIDVAAAQAVSLEAGADDWWLSIQAAPTQPGVAITAQVDAEGQGGGEADMLTQTLRIQNDLVIEGDVVYRLYDWQERNQIVSVLQAGPIGHALRAVAPYAEAIDAHMTEARPALTVVGLFQSWPEGVEPPWPALDGPRDSEPPGHREGDVIGLGMTCSTAIRCPSFAPYCVTIDHEVEFGFCTRACATDDDCVTDAGVGRCTMPVTDIPGVTESVLACRVACDADNSCPGLLACEQQTATCEAVNAP